MTSSLRTGPAGAAADAVRALAHTGLLDIDGAVRDALSDIEIVRRACRGEDELLLVLHPEGSWWVARRVDGVARVCAYIGDSEADRDFDLFLTSPSPRGEWTEIEVREPVDDVAAPLVVGGVAAA